MRKGQLASDRTSCQSLLANQVRLVLHTGAYACHEAKLEVLYCVEQCINDNSSVAARRWAPMAMEPLTFLPTRTE